MMTHVPPITLVIADDHVIMREGLAMTLNNEPDLKVVAEASNGRDVLTLIQQHQPDIALLDITMENMTGLEVARQSQANFPHVKLIFLTMHEDTEFFFEALRSGASGYVLKGSRTNVLLAAIRAVHKGGIYLSPQLAGELVDEFFTRPPQPPETAEDELTDREKEVLILIARGLTNRDIARRLEVSINTIKTHRLNIYQKLDLRGHASLLDYALCHGLLHPPPTFPKN